MNSIPDAVQALSILDAYLVKYHTAADLRGLNTFPLVTSQLTASTQRDFTIAQINVTYSQPHTFRGVHLTTVPPGQAKYICAIQGACIDILVDLRIGSPSFKTVCYIPLSAAEPQGVYIPEGVGHGILCMNEAVTVLYCCNQEYNPEQDITLNPYDSTLGLKIPADCILSDKDRDAPNMSEVDLPYYENYLRLFG